MEDKIIDIHHQVRSKVLSLYSSLSAIQENLYNPETCKELLELMMRKRPEIENIVDEILELQNTELKQ